MFRPRTVVAAVVLSLFLRYLESDANKRVPFGRKPYRPASSYGIRRPSLKRDRFKYLFPTAAALGGIYIASHMRPRTHFRSYHDLYQHTVCEGLRTEYDESMRTMRTYNYFICPDDPDQPFERYCCTDYRNSGGFCCSYDEKVRHYSTTRWAAIGGSIAALAIVCLIVAVIYCLCCRRNRHSPSTLVSSSLPPTANGRSGAFPRTQPPSTCPYPATMPSAEHYPPYSSGGGLPQPGSGWAAPPTAQPGFGWNSSPPPPYSAK